MKKSFEADRYKISIAGRLHGETSTSQSLRDPEERFGRKN